MQNVTGLSPARRRQERKRRSPGQRKQQARKSEEALNELNNEETMKPENATDENDHHIIDYQA